MAEQVDDFDTILENYQKDGDGYEEFVTLLAAEEKEELKDLIDKFKDSLIGAIGKIGEDITRLIDKCWTSKKE